MCCNVMCIIILAFPLKKLLSVILSLLTPFHLRVWHGSLGAAAEISPQNNGAIVYSDTDIPHDVFMSWAESCQFGFANFILRVLWSCLISLQKRVPCLWVCTELSKMWAEGVNHNCVDSGILLVILLPSCQRRHSFCNRQLQPPDSVDSLTLCNTFTLSSTSIGIMVSVMLEKCSVTKLSID